jgi:hypothetical protein
LADQLDVSASEAEIVSQNIGKPFPAATHFACAPVTKISGELTRKNVIFWRRQLIREIIQEAGNDPSLRKMEEQMRRQHGFEMSYVTVKADYAAMGIVPRTKEPRPESSLLPCFRSPDAGRGPSLLLALET